MSLTRLNISAPDGFLVGLTNVTYDYSPNFTGGVAFNIVLPGSMRNFSVNNEIIYSAFQVSGHYFERVSNNINNNFYSSFNYHYISMKNMLRFSYPLGRWAIFANVGISNGIAISRTNIMRTESYFYGTENVSEGQALTNTRNYEQGFLAGAGTRYLNFTFEFRFDKGNGMSSAGGVDTSTLKYFFLFGYFF
jgi:hypothetical protein